MSPRRGGAALVSLGLLAAACHGSAAASGGTHRPGSTGRASPGTPTSSPSASASAGSATGSVYPPLPSPTLADTATLAEARQKIKHVVFIVKENRTFDTYFGTFPGADGATSGRT